MNWARDIFVKNARLYELVLDGMWDKGEGDAVAISGFLQENGMARCHILDVPCGIGRVGVPLAQLGFNVTGLDYSSHLVKVASERAKSLKVSASARFAAGNMLELGSRFGPQSFDCAINVFTSIGYGSEEDDLTFFREVRKVVRTGGLLLVSGLRNRDYIARNPSQNVYEETDRLLVLDRYHFDVPNSREKGLWRFYIKMGGILKWAGEFPTDIRIYSPQELSKMFRDSGWRLTGVYGSFAAKDGFSAESPVYALAAEAV